MVCVSCWLLDLLGPKWLQGLAIAIAIEVELAIAIAIAAAAAAAAGWAATAAPAAAVAAAPAAPVGGREDVPPPPKMAIAGAGICHIYGLPEGFDAKGLRIGGAVQGEIFGEPIGGPMGYVAALTTCVNDPTCTGVTSTW